MGANSSDRRSVLSTLMLLTPGAGVMDPVALTIERAIERVHEARWRSADLLLVSDGEFGCTEAMLRALARRDTKQLAEPFIPGVVSTGYGGLPGRELRGLPAPVKTAGCIACAAGELCCEEHGRG